MKRLWLGPRLVMGCALLLAACESEYDPIANVSDRPGVCPSSVAYRSCLRPGSCVEWGYPGERLSEIEEAGRSDCSASGGRWTPERCPEERFAAGCRNVWGSTCVTVWVDATVGNLEERRDACQLYLGGVWIRGGAP